MLHLWWLGRQAIWSTPFSPFRVPSPLHPSLCRREQHGRTQLLLLYLRRGFHELHLGQGPRSPRRRPIFPAYPGLKVSVPLADTPVRNTAKKERRPCPACHLTTWGSCRRKTERPCRHYATEAGTHVGCHLDFVSQLRHQTYVLVNGSSEKAGIQFFDAILLLKKIGKERRPP